MSPTSPRQRRATQPRMSESELLDYVIGLAHLRGWRCAHFRPALTAKGYRTVMQGDTGYPDLTLVKPVPVPVLPPNSTLAQEVEYQQKLRLREWSLPRILFVELKSDRGRVSPEQQAWLDALSPYSAVWRPSMWHSGEIERALR